MNNNDELVNYYRVNSTKRGNRIDRLSVSLSVTIWYKFNKTDLQATTMQFSPLGVQGF